MELLDEYQQALKKIQELEAKLKDYENAVDSARRGLDTMSQIMDSNVEMFGAETEQEKKVVDHLFIYPKRLLGIIDGILEVPTLNGDEQLKAKQQLGKDGLKLILDNLKRFEEKE